jgi:hypothetical protein
LTVTPASPARSRGLAFAVAVEIGEDRVADGAGVVDAELEEADAVLAGAAKNSKLVGWWGAQRRIERGDSAVIVADGVVALGNEERDIARAVGDRGAVTGLPGCRCR